MFIRVCLVFVFCLGFSNAYGLEVGEISYRYEASLDSQYVIGVMPTVVLRSAPGAKICGRWYKGNQPANVPNGANPQSSYCRIANNEGSTFFTYRDRFATHYPISTWDADLVDLSQRNIRFNVTFPTNQFISVGY